MILVLIETARVFPKWLDQSVRAAVVSGNRLHSVPGAYRSTRFYLCAPVCRLRQLAGTRLGSGGFRFASVSSFLGPGSRDHGSQGTFFSCTLVTETEGHADSPMALSLQLEVHLQTRHMAGSSIGGGSRAPISQQGYAGSILLEEGEEDPCAPPSVACASPCSVGGSFLQRSMLSTALPFPI